MPATAEPANAHVAIIMNRITMDIVCLSPVNERMAWIYFQRLRERSFSVVERQGKLFLLTRLMLDRLDFSQTANSEATVPARASRTLNFVSSVATHRSGES
jgi:hypothetical protein